MKPPIASPHAEHKPFVPVTGRLQWDKERECFTLHYCVSLWGRLRGEWHIVTQSLWMIWILPMHLPIVALSIVIAAFVQRHKRPSEFSVFAWGIEYHSIEAAYRTEWKDVGEASVHDADFFVLLKRLMEGHYCLPRENFADEEETRRLLEIIQLLKSRNGANWEAVKSQFPS